MKKIALLCTAMTLAISTMMTACSKDNTGNNSEDLVRWIDMGLPSKLLWADRNIGASSPEAYGDYFAWGETSAKKIYDWSTYKYGKADSMLTKYCGNPELGENGYSDPFTTLHPIDDAATQILGNGVRTPTREEWLELLGNTGSVWIEQNGVYGRLLTGSNGNTLFLPAAGNRYDSTLYNDGQYGRYWSSTLNTDIMYTAWYGHFYSSQGIDRYHRIHGFSIRAVCAAQ